MNRIAFREMIDSEILVLGEAAVLEILRRDRRVHLHPFLEHGLLIYEEEGRAALTRVHNRYINVAKKIGLPVIVSTPTWRTNPERLKPSGHSGPAVHRDAVSFLRTVRSNHGSFAQNIWIAGLMGCRGDAYQPGQALSVADAYEFHSEQARELADAGADLLVAVTLPAVSEAEGIARAMEETRMPFIISFVVGSDGNLLEGTSLETAIERIDAVAPPLFYGINCAHPDFYHFEKVLPSVRQRIGWFQGNGAACDHADLDGSEELLVDDVSVWALRSGRLHREAGIKVLGGCCGTDENHLEAFLEVIRYPVRSGN